MNDRNRQRSAPANEPPAPAPEFSRIFRISGDMGSGADATRFEIEAEPAERKALARRFGLIALERLAAKGTIEVFDRGRRAKLDGRVEGDVVQECVVTLEPVRNRVEDRVVIVFDRDVRAAGGGGSASTEVDIDPEAAEDIEHLPSGGIDVGEAVAECLGLALDPYPRAPGADEAVAEITGKGKEAPRKSAFAALERLKRR